jgi:citrate/tricarballylate utilization protein
MLAMIAPQLFWGVHLGEGAFYRIMPHTMMAAVPLAISAFVVVSFVMGWRRYWRHTGAKWSGFPDLVDAVKARSNASPSWRRYVKRGFVWAGLSDRR